MTLSSGAELDILTEGDPNGPKTLDDGYKSVAGSEGAAEASDKSGFSPTSTDEQHSVDLQGHACSSGSTMFKFQVILPGST